MTTERNPGAPTGKMAPRALEEHILAFRGTPREDVLVGPAVGEDAAVIALPGGPFLVAASDPVVGAAKGAGRLLVHVNANDVASKGGEPAYLLVTMILPRSMTERDAAAFMKEMHEACLELNIAIVGGHTEFSDRYAAPVLSGTLLGYAERCLRAEEMRPGDVLLMTKHVGLEGMSILAADRPDLLTACCTQEEIREIRSWGDSLSVLPEARILRPWTRFLHDPTEGGFLGGLGELARLSRAEVRLLPETVTVHPLTRRCAQTLAFDPLHLISSGVLLAVLPPEHLDEAGRCLSGAGIPFSVVGSLVETGGNVPFDAREELWRLLVLEVPR